MEMRHIGRSIFRFFKSVFVKDHHRKIQDIARLSPCLLVLLQTVDIYIEYNEERLNGLMS